MLNKIFIVLVALKFASAIPSTQRRFNLEVYGITCTNHSSLVKRLDCNVQKVGNSRYLFATNFTTNQQLAKNADVRTVIYVKIGYGQRQYKFLDLKFNLCDALSTAMPVPLAKELLDEARRTSNLPYTCPMKRNYLYRMNNYSLTAASIPPYAAFINFTFELNLYESQKLVVTAVVKGGTVPKS